MSKVTVSIGYDIDGKQIIILKKKRGRISLREAYEALEKDFHGQYVLRIPITEEVPENLYEDDDAWEIYKTEDFVDEIADEKFREGYDACMKDYNLGKII